MSWHWKTLRDDSTEPSVYVLMLSGKCYVFHPESKYTTVNVHDHVRDHAVDVTDDVHDTFVANHSLAVLYAAAVNSGALGLAPVGGLMSFDKLKTALCYAVYKGVPDGQAMIRKYHKYGSSNAMWKWSVRKPDVADGSSNPWQSMTVSATKSIKLVQSTDYNLLVSGFYNQFAYLSDMPDMPSTNSLASYPGTIIHLALSYYSGCYANEAKDQVGTILDLNDPLLPAIAQAVHKTEIKTEVVHEESYCVPFVSWGATVRMVFPDLSNDSTVIEFKTRWGNATGDILIDAPHYQHRWQLMFQAACVGVHKQTSVKAKLITVGIPKTLVPIKAFKLKRCSKAVPAALCSTVYRQALARMLLYRQHLDGLYSDEYCAFPLAGPCGEFVMRARSTACIVVYEAPDKIYEYVPAIVANAYTSTVRKLAISYATFAALEHAWAANWAVAVDASNDPLCTTVSVRSDRYFKVTAAVERRIAANTGIDAASVFYWFGPKPYARPCRSVSTVRRSRRLETARVEADARQLAKQAHAAASNADGDAAETILTLARGLDGLVSALTPTRRVTRSMARNSP